VRFGVPLGRRSRAVVGARWSRPRWGATSRSAVQACTTFSDAGQRTETAVGVGLLNPMPAAGGLDVVRRVTSTGSPRRGQPNPRPPVLTATMPGAGPRAGTTAHLNTDSVTPRCPPRDWWMELPGRSVRAPGWSPQGGIDRLLVSIDLPVRHHSDHRDCRVSPPVQPAPTIRSDTRG